MIPFSILDGTTMNVERDDAAFDDCQMELVYQILGAIHRELVGQGIAAGKVKDISADIAFNVCALIDGSASLEAGGKRIVPVLMFSRDLKVEQLMWAGGPSSLHEYVFGAADDYFESQ